MLIRLFIAPVLVVLLAAPVVAKPVVIAELGTAPLLGTSSSTAQMRERVSEQSGFVAQAVHKLGLSHNDYEHYVAAIASSHVDWVTVPRHLDAMTWRSGSTVYVLHDVVIPARTHGWRVDLRSGDQNLALYMPAACGNVSLVRSPAKVVAQAPAPVRVKAPVAIVATPAVVPPADPPAAIPDDTPVAAPVTVAQTEFPPVAAAATHRAPLFLIPLLFAAAALSGGTGSGPVATVPDGCP